MFFFSFTGSDITFSFFDISKCTGANVWCQNAYITETFTKLSWTPDKLEENDLNLIVKYVCAAYVHIIAFIRTTLIGCGSFYLQSRVVTNSESFPSKRGFAASYFTFSVRF